MRKTALGNPTDFWHQTQTGSQTAEGYSSKQKEKGLYYICYFKQRYSDKCKEQFTFLKKKTVK